MTSLDNYIDIPSHETTTTDTLTASEYLLTKHARRDRRPDDDDRIRMLSRAQLRGWLVYPLENDTPATVATRGRRLLAALADGDEEAAVRAGGFPWSSRGRRTAEERRTQVD